MIQIQSPQIYISIYIIIGEAERNDGSIIGYTHKGGGMIVVFRIGGFLER